MPIMGAMRAQASKYHNFWKVYKNLQSLLPSAKGLSFTFMLSLHLLPLCTVWESIVVILSIMCMVPKFIIDWFMIIVLLVLKLFVYSHPLKLEGVLCIYVLLIHEGQAEYHFAMFFYMLETHYWLSLHYYSWSFVCVTFHVITWLLSSIVKIISLMPMFRVLWSQHSMLYIVLIKIVVGACHLKNYCFVITYLLEDDKELSLGMLDMSQTYL
jgi:hypothetical protein